MKATGTRSSQGKATLPGPLASADLHERISRRAQELYELRGRGDGHELEDWLQAEAEITKGKGKAPDICRTEESKDRQKEPHDSKRHA